LSTFSEDEGEQWKWVSRKKEGKRGLIFIKAPYMDV
jgi:hypothetical protein